jgi:magnesium chelatase subunit D
MTRSSTRPSGLLPPTLERLLECASLQEELGSVVLYNATPELLEQVAEAWRGHLAALGVAARRVQLGPWTSEEDLWGQGAAVLEAWQRSGLLDSREPRLVVIPDLTLLSLAALRACVSWMGSEAVAIERTGQSHRFQPHCYWLAGCMLEEVGQVSPHLLDRFALRVRAPAAPRNDTEELLRALESAPSTLPRSEPARPGPEAARLMDAARVEVQMTDEARAAVLQRFPPMAGAGHRGLLTLGRMACALARFDEKARATPGAPAEVRAEHVQQAALLLQLPGAAQGPAQAPKAPKEPIAAPEARVDAPLAPKTEAPSPQASGQSLPVSPPEASGVGVTVAPVQVSPPESQTAALLAPLEVERTTPVQREHAPLRLPSFQGGLSVKGRGPVLGVQPATDMQDLAIVSTLLAAAPYQRFRRRQSGARGKGLLLMRSDLRSYRRAPVPEHLLTLVLDFTSAPKGWQQALAPYLAEAYVERARVCVIQVGARSDEGANGEGELRARRVLARNLLVPAVARALEAEPGRATPLADGLDLALSTLRRSLRVGRGAAHHAWLIVVTDGRGNVPLEVSRTGVLQPLVGRRGVEDALRVAAQLRGMRQVTSVVLKPPLMSLRELPVQLANVLGAELVELSPPEPVEGGAAP